MDNRKTVKRSVRGPQLCLVCSDWKRLHGDGKRWREAVAGGEEDAVESVRVNTTYWDLAALTTPAPKHEYDTLTVTPSLWRRLVLGIKETT